MPLTFDEIAPTFDDQRGLPIAAIQAWVARVRDLAAGRALAIVEPGIGTGRLTLPLAADGHRVSGVDMSAPMLEQCRVRAASIGASDRMHLIQGSATDLPFPDHTFDLGIVAQLFYLMPDWTDALDELDRVVRRGGVVVHVTEETTLDRALAQWNTAWRDVIERTGYRHLSTGPTSDDVAAEMRRRWPDTSVTDIASWRFGQSVGEALDGYSERLRPLYRDIPAAAWDNSVATFLDWVHTNMPDATTRLDGTVSLRLTWGDV